MPEPRVINSKGKFPNRMTPCKLFYGTKFLLKIPNVGPQIISNSGFMFLFSFFFFNA